MVLPERLDAIVSEQLRIAAANNAKENIFPD